MNIVNRILSVSLSISLLIVIFELVRMKKLKEKYALLWLVTGIAIFILAVFDKLLSAITRMLGIQFPINAMFFLGIFFIILINLHFSLAISSLVEQNRKIAQKLALLEIKIKNIEKNDKE